MNPDCSQYEDSIANNDGSGDELESSAGTLPGDHTDPRSYSYSLARYTNNPERYELFSTGTENLVATGLDAIQRSMQPQLPRESDRNPRVSEGHHERREAQDQEDQRRRTESKEGRGSIGKKEKKEKQEKKREKKGKKGTQGSEANKKQNSTMDANFNGDNAEEDYYSGKESSRDFYGHDY